jgi:hypothetical protein
MSNVLYCNNQYEWCDTCLVTKLWSISLGTMTEDTRILEISNPACTTVTGCPKNNQIC